jgi:glycosyltransferase involved in cell wall biosynthesis
MPYGGDVQDMTRTHNLLFKHAISKDYPENKNNRSMISKKIDLWTLHANHVIGGCDWVDYLYHWDSLCLAHFCLDTDAVDNVTINAMPKKDRESLIIFHAPNHTNIKGTAQLIRAVDELRKEGYNLELNIRQKVSNKEILIEISKSDIVVDQLIIGWYGMFALEAMAQGKPVICYVRDDLENLYISSGLLEKDGLPIIKSSASTIKETLTKILHKTINLEAVREKSKEFVTRHHSVKAIGHMFNEINKKIL